MGHNCSHCGKDLATAASASCNNTRCPRDNNLERRSAICSRCNGTGKRDRSDFFAQRVAFETCSDCFGTGYRNGERPCIFDMYPND
ncbi:MAG: hypothetical protein WAX89_03080 [Alphaproteobacteria bacterium]